MVHYVCGWHCSRGHCVVGTLWLELYVGNCLAVLGVTIYLGHCVAGTVMGEMS